jgi:hypothetical protein
MLQARTSQSSHVLALSQERLHLRLRRDDMVHSECYEHGHDDGYRHIERFADDVDVALGQSGPFFVRLDHREILLMLQRV